MKPIEKQIRHNIIISAWDKLKYENTSLFRLMQLQNYLNIQVWANIEHKIWGELYKYER